MPGRAKVTKPNTANDKDTVFYYTKRKKRAASRAAQQSCSTTTKDPQLFDQQERRDDLFNSDSLDVDRLELELRGANPSVDTRVTPHNQVNTIPYIELAPGTDLLSPPPHYLRVNEAFNIHRQAPGYRRDRLSQGLAQLVAEMLSTERPDKMASAGVHICPKVVMSDAVLQAMVDYYVLDLPLTLLAVRMGPFLVIDTVGTEQSTPDTHHERALFAKLLYRMTDVIAAVSCKVQTDARDRHTELRPAESDSSAVIPMNSAAERLEAPRIGTVATTSIDGTNSWETCRTFTNSFVWQLPGNFNVLLGVDRPIFHSRHLARLVPLAVVDHDVKSEGGMSDTQAMKVWLSAMLSGGTNPMIHVCEVVGGRVDGYTTRLASDITSRKACRNAHASLDFSSALLRWLRYRCVEQGLPYTVTTRRMISRRHLDIKELESIGDRRASPPPELGDDAEHLFRREQCVALMSLSVAELLLASYGPFSDDALQLLLRSARWMSAAALDCYARQLSELRRALPTSAFRDADPNASILNTLSSVAMRLGSVVNVLISREKNSDATQRALTWSRNVGSVFTALLNCLHSVHRDTSVVLATVASTAHEISAAADALWLRTARRVRSWVLDAAKTALRAVTSAHRDLNTVSSMTHCIIGLLSAEECAECVRLSMPPQSSASITSPPSTGTSALYTSLNDTESLASLAQLHLALKEHTADVLIRCMGPSAAEWRQSVREATEQVPSETLRGPCGAILIQNCLSDIDVAALGYRCLALITSCGSSARVSVKSARAHLYVGHQYRLRQRHTKALDALTIATEMLKAVSFAGTDSPLIDASFAVPLEDIRSHRRLQTAVHIELALLHRDRARFERASANNVLTEAALRSWDKAINGLREESTVDLEPSDAAAARAALGAMMLEFVETATADGDSHTRTGLPTIWYSDLLEKLNQADALLQLHHDRSQFLRLKLLNKALNDCKYTALTGTSLNVATILATRQHWAAVGWSAIIKWPRGKISNEQVIISETESGKENLLRLTLTAADMCDAILTFLVTMSQLNLTAELTSPDAARRPVPLPSRRRLLVEVVDVVLSMDGPASGSAAVWQKVHSAILDMVRRATNTAALQSLAASLSHCLGVITGCGCGSSNLLELNTVSLSKCRDALTHLRRSAMGQPAKE